MSSGGLSDPTGDICHTAWLTEILTRACSAEGPSEIACQSGGDVLR